MARGSKGLVSAAFERRRVDYGDLVPKPKNPVVMSAKAAAERLKAHLAAEGRLRDQS